jgi:tRNA nucleotidyltransferase (CCA-adding enzyme)
MSNKQLVLKLLRRSAVNLYAKKKQKFEFYASTSSRSMSQQLDQPQQQLCRLLSNENNTTSLKVYELKSPLYEEMLNDELLLLRRLFDKYKYELRIAGGAVRDILMNIRPHDVDMATNALPEQMLDMFHKENVRIINEHGIKHGTVPVLVNDKTVYEITTLRIDVKTFGRHAEVEFTGDWHKDAIRRDLTINSLFLGSLQIPHL